MVKILSNISEESFMSKEQAIKYLQNVLDTWTAFCDEHKVFAMAIKVLLKEVEG